MSIVRQNLEQGNKSGMSISKEGDRKLVEKMVRNNIIDEHISFDELVKAIENSNGNILKYQRNNSILYFDSTGRYINDYKITYDKSSLKEFSTKPEVDIQSVNMYRGRPIIKARKDVIETEVKETKVTETESPKVRMYRGVRIID